jgi:hypothetical protein
VSATGSDVAMHAKFQINFMHIYLQTINLVSEFLEFCTKIYRAKVSSDKPTEKSGPKGFIQNLVCNF